MSICNKCGTEIQPEDKFCGNCGASIADSATEQPKRKSKKKSGSNNVNNLSGKGNAMSMRITDVVVEWLIEQEWEERPEIDEENQSSSLFFAYKVGDFSLRCYFDVAEQQSFFKMYVYLGDTKIPEPKVPEVLKMLNIVNCSYPVGSLRITPNERSLLCYHGMDFEDASFEAQHISNMFNLLVSIMKYRIPQVLAICFGGKTAEEALEIEPDE